MRARLAIQGFMFCQPWRHGWSALGFLTTMALGAAGGTGKETFRVLKRAPGAAFGATIWPQSAITLYEGLAQTSAKKRRRGTL